MTKQRNFAQLKRRDFLKFIGKAGVSLKALQASSLGAGVLLARQAAAQATAQRRVIFIYVPDGTPQGASHSFTPSANLQLKPCSAPLEQVKQECVFLDNVDIVGGGGHGLTQRVLGAFAEGVSGTIDLALGETVGATSPVDALRLGVRTRNVDPISARSFTGVNDYQDNPQAAFERLFGSSLSTDSAATLRARKIQLINEAALGEIKTKLGNYELQRIEQHESAIEKLKQLIDNAEGNEAPGSCQNVIFNRDNLSHEQVDTEFTNIFKLQTENAILALACNLTRVVTLQLGTHQSDFSVTGLSGEYHSAIHSGREEPYTEFRTYFSSLVAHLIQRLAEEDDPAGGKMIDSTLLVQVTDMGNGDAHSGSDAPFMFAGGGAAVNRGQLVSVGNHHQLLDTAAQYMGVSGSIAAYSSEGPVSGILT